MKRRVQIYIVVGCSSLNQCFLKITNNFQPSIFFHWKTNGLINTLKNYNITFSPSIVVVNITQYNITTCSCESNELLYKRWVNGVYYFPVFFTHQSIVHIFKLCCHNFSSSSLIAPCNNNILLLATWWWDMIISYPFNTFAFVC